MYKSVLCSAFTMLFLMIFQSPIQAGNLSISFSIPEESVTLSPQKDAVEIEGFSVHTAPGFPDLPKTHYVVALPPGCTPESVILVPDHQEILWEQILILPAPVMHPKQDRCEHPELYQYADSVYAKNIKTYITRRDGFYPDAACEIIETGHLGPIPYAIISLSPCQYNRGSNQLKVTLSGTIEMSFKNTLSSPGQQLCKATLYEQAMQLFHNVETVERYYCKEVISRNKSVDYVILSAEELVPSITASSFISWKQTIGLTPEIVTVTDPLITSQPGHDLAEKIRNYLRNRYAVTPFDYLLIIGDIYTVPMRYCYPEPYRHFSGAGDPLQRSDEVPTDYYYADLSASDAEGWDLDGDGYYGEYGQDNPDLFAEVSVGRIPTSNTVRITYTLNKTVTFEQDQGAWKNNALHAGAFYYFTNEDHSGLDADDGATCPDYMETDLMTGWSISHYSEQEGLEKSAYPWLALAEKPFSRDWELGQYGVVNEGAHGASDQIARKLWLTDDGDGVPESSEISWSSFLDTQSKLDDDYPSIFCAMSCLVGYPETNTYGNLGIDLVTKPGWGASVAAVVSSRIVYGPFEWSPLNGGGCESICYEFNRYLINDDLPVGTAMYRGKIYTHINFSLGGFTEYITMYEYNLYGDPSLVRQGVNPLMTPVPTATAVASPTPAPVPQTLYTDNFENTVVYCTGPYGSSGCSSQWLAYSPVGGGYPAACQGNRIAWHEYDACNPSYGPDHLLIMNGDTDPDHDMTGYTDITLSLNWYYNNNAYGETIEIWIADAPYASLDCSDLSFPWELIYSDTDTLFFDLGSCGSWDIALPASCNHAENLVIAVRYHGYDGDTIGLDNMSLSGYPPPTPTPVPVPGTSHEGIAILILGLSVLIGLTINKKHAF